MRIWETEQTINATRNWETFLSCALAASNPHRTPTHYLFTELRQGFAFPIYPINTNTLAIRVEFNTLSDHVYFALPCMFRWTQPVKFTAYGILTPTQKWSKDWIILQILQTKPPWHHGLLLCEKEGRKTRTENKIAKGNGGFWLWSKLSTILKYLGESAGNIRLMFKYTLKLLSSKSLESMQMCHII